MGFDFENFGMILFVRSAQLFLDFGKHFIGRQAADFRQITAVPSFL